MLDIQTQNNIEGIKLEYEQVCQIIRQSWDYIVALVRNVIIFQIILVSLVGLGGNFISIEKMKINNSDQINQQAESTNQGIKNNPQTQEANVNSSIRKISLISLSYLGIIISISFLIQTHYIFLHAEKFVERAAKLEEKFDHYSEGDTHHSYMLNQLGNRKLLSAENMLKLLLLAAFGFWIYVTTQIHSVV